MLYYRTIDGAAEVCMVVGENTGLITNSVEDVLESSFPKKLVSCSKWNLNHCGEFGKLSRGVVLNVGDALGAMRR